MRELQILELNDDCLCNVLKYLQMRDLFHLSQASANWQHIVKIFTATIYRKIEWNGCGKFTKNFKQKLLLGCEHFKEMRLKAGGNHLESTEILCQKIRKMVMLEHLEITPISSCTELDGMFWKSVLHAFQELPNLKILHIIGGNSVGFNYPICLRHLEELTVDSDIDAQVLLECCMSTSKLSVLHLNRVYNGYLANIISHCNNLEELKLSLQSNVDYKPLAKLPKLRKLIINGYENINGICDMFRCISSEKMEQITYLRIGPAYCTSEMTKQISRMRHLKYLSYRCPDPQYMELLTQLTDLEALCIDWTIASDCSDQLLSIIRASEKLKCLRIMQAKKMPPDFIFEVSDILKAVGSSRKRMPLSLELFDHGLDLPATKHMSTLLKVRKCLSHRSYPDVIAGDDYFYAR